MNLLWFVSFVLSLSCALLATSLQQWARRYITVTQPARCSPEKRARTRAFFAHGVDKFYARLAAEQLPLVLHLSVIFFLVGLVLFIFNINSEISNVILAFPIPVFILVYGTVTLLPIFWPDSPYFTPLSILMSRIIRLVFTTILMLFSAPFLTDLKIKGRFKRWINRWLRWEVWGVERRVQETVLERSWEFDLSILSWSIRTLNDDDTLEKFLEATPGFFKSKMVKHLDGDFPEYLLNKFWNVVNGLLCRTLSSNSVAESVKSHRLDICMKAMNVISSRASDASSIPCDILVRGWNQGSQIAEMGPNQLLTLCNSDHELTAHYAQCIVTKILASVPERDDRWIKFASDALGPSMQDLRGYINHGNDSVPLAIWIHLIQQSIRSHFYDWDALTAFSVQPETLPGLQHHLRVRFCTLRNQIVREASKQESKSILFDILRLMHPFYIVLHPCANDASTAFSAFTPCPHHIRSEPSSYSLRGITSHHPDSTAPTATSPLSAHTGPCPTDASPRPPGAAATALQDIPGPATSSHPLEETSSTGLTRSPTSTPVPASASTPPDLNNSSASRDAYTASTSNPLPPASSVVPSIPTLPQSSVSPLPDTEPPAAR